MTEEERIQLELTLQQDQEVLYGIYNSLEETHPGEFRKEDFELNIIDGEDPFFDCITQEDIDKLEALRLKEIQSQMPQTLNDIIEETKENSK